MKDIINTSSKVATVVISSIIGLVLSGIAISALGVFLLVVIVKYITRAVTRIVVNYFKK